MHDMLPEEPLAPQESSDDGKQKEQHEEKNEHMDEYRDESDNETIHKLDHLKAHVHLEHDKQRFEGMKGEVTLETHDEISDLKAHIKPRAHQETKQHEVPHYETMSEDEIASTAEQTRGQIEAAVKTSVINNPYIPKRLKERAT